MPLITVRSSLDPFAAIEVRNGDQVAIAAGTGAVVVDAAPGAYAVFASASGRQALRRVELIAQDVVAEVQLGPYPSAAPTARTSTNSAGHGAATQSLSEQLVRDAAGSCAIGVIVRRPGGASIGGPPRGRDGSLPVELADDGGRRIDLAWTAAGGALGGDYAAAGTAVSPGMYTATIGGGPRSSLAVPVWDGWQTLLFLPATGGGIAGSLAVVHVVPIGTAWTPALPLAELLDQLHWAMIERQSITDACLEAVRGGTDRQFLASPMAHLLLGTLSSMSTGEPAARQARESLRVLQDQRADVTLSDVVALELAVDEGSGPVVALAPPVLARSADVLIERERRTLRTIGGGAVDALATRLASPLWFRWVPGDGDTTGTRIYAYSDGAWRRGLTRAASALPTVASLEDVADGADPSARRLVAYLHDESRRRRSTPADVLMAAHPAELVRGTGLPAIGVLRALNTFGPSSPPPDQPPDPPRPVGPQGSSLWLRVVLGLIVAVAIGAGLWVWRAVADDDTTDDEAATSSVTTPALSTTVASVTTPPTTTTSPGVTTTTASPTTPSTTAPPLENVAPTAAPMTFETLDGATLNENVIANDPDGDVLTYRRVDGEFAGSLELRDDGSFSYSPADGEEEATFTFAADDGTAEGAAAVVTVLVLPRAEAKVFQVEESVGSQTVPVSLTRTARTLVLVRARTVEAPESVSATADEDFAPLDTVLSFRPGEVEQDVDIDVVGDDAPENDEQFILRLTVEVDGTLDPADAAMTIIDDDRDDSPETTVPDSTDGTIFNEP